MLKLVRALRGCAKRKDVAGAVQLFERHADAGIALPRDAYHTLLSLAVLEDATDVRRQVQWHMRKHDVPVDEVTLTLEVRALVREGDLAAAASGLQTAEVDGIIPKHRRLRRCCTRCARSATSKPRQPCWRRCSARESR